MSAPRIGEKTLAREVQAVLRNNGGTNAERAGVAAGMIEAKVRAAYGVDGPLVVTAAQVEGYELDVATRFMFLAPELVA